MKLLALELQAFGCFTGTRLEFADDGPSFHLIHGENEAGKSTALRGLTHFFYGIPGQTEDDFLHAANRLRIGMSLLRADGERLDGIRRKGLKATLESPGAEPLEESVLAAFVGGISEQTFRNVYRLDHETLVRGGEDLLLGKGDLAQSLYEAGAGVTGLRETQAALEAEADAIFRPRASRPALNLQLAEYRNAAKRSRDLSLRPAAWEELQRQFTEAVKALAAARGEAEQWQRELRRMERIATAREPAARLRLVQEELAELGGAVLLPESAPAERLEITGRLRAAEEARDKAAARLEQRRAELKKLHAPADLLGQAAAIQALQQRLDSHERAVADLPGVRHQSRAAATEAEKLFRSLRMTEPPELSASERERIEALATGHAVLAERAAEAEARRRETEAALISAREQLAGEAVDEEPGPLRLLLARVQREGDLEILAEQAGARARKAEEKGGRAVKRLEYWSGTGAELEQCALPGAESIERFDADLAAAQAAEAAAARREIEAAAQWQLAETQLRTLRLGGEVPTEEQLQLRRRRREEGWQRIRSLWLLARAGRRGIPCDEGASGSLRGSGGGGG